MARTPTDWAVFTLADLFTTHLQVGAEQAVVDHGPCRWVRHPSYTGLLLIAWASASASALAVPARSLVIPPLGVLPRIAVEKAELTRVLGQENPSYRSGTRGLLPGVW